MNDDILTALVLILARQLAAEQKAKGVTRLGGDYTKDAVELIKENRVHVTQLLR